jgi:hypothetical protein
MTSDEIAPWLSTMDLSSIRKINRH